MSNVTEETILRSLNARIVTTGSKVSAATSALASSTVTAFTGGLVLTNASTTATETIWFSTSGAAVVNGATSSILHAGAIKPLAWGDLSTLRFIAGSGTPYLTWEGTTL